MTPGAYFVHQNKLFFLHHTGRNDLDTAAQSGFGVSGGGCEQGVPTELALLSILAAFGISFGILYMAATTNMARRRKRGSDLSFGDMFSDVLWKGENFSLNKELKDVRCPSKTT